MRNVEKMVYDYKEKFSVQGEKRIVAGGAQGLSRGMAKGLLEDSTEVVLTDLQKEELEQAVEEYCGKDYKTRGVAGGLSKRAGLDRMLDEAMELLGGKLDVMIPTAGVQRHCKPWEFPEEVWNPVINVDLNHVWFMCQRAIQVTRDEDAVGKVISIGSMNSSFGGTTVPACSAIKGAVTQLSESTTSDCAGRSICCNVIVPDYMDTEAYANMNQERKDECTRWITIGRQDRPEDLKGPVLFLASSASDYLNGAVIPVGGGLLAKSWKVD